MLGDQTGDDVGHHLVGRRVRAVAEPLDGLAAVVIPTPAEADNSPGGVRLDGGDGLTTEIGSALSTAWTTSKTDSVPMATLQLVAKVPDDGVQDGQSVHDAFREPGRLTMEVLAGLRHGRGSARRAAFWRPAV